MKVVICAGPPTSGKTAVLKQVAKKLLAADYKLAYLKIDVQYADEDEVFQEGLGIPAKKIYSGELCPDHCSVLVLGDAIKWAQAQDAAMLTLADIAVMTKIDLVSQAEREVFRANIMDAADVAVVETDALHGINIDPITARIVKMQETSEPWVLRGNPPVSTCTICTGKKDIGWEKHFGIVRTLDSDLFYRGQ